MKIRPPKFLRALRDRAFKVSPGAMPQGAPLDSAEGAKIGIITGRGESFFADGLPALYRAGLDDRSASNLSVYLFNGARPVSMDEWPQFGSRSSIDPSTQARLETLLRGRLRGPLPFLPQRIAVESSVDLPQHTILKECFGDECFQYTIAGLSRAERFRAISVLEQALAQEGLPLTAMEGGEMVLINPLGADKGRALDDFAAAIGIDPSEILKFGDKAGPKGNDRPFLRDANAFNVGPEPADHPATVNVGLLGPEGVLAVLDEADRSGRPIRAIASDFDGTLNPGGIEHRKTIDPRLAERFVDYARRGTKIAIITGRGDSLFPHYLPALRHAGLDAAAAQNLSIYLFNGARPVQPEEWLGRNFDRASEPALEALDQPLRIPQTA